MRNIGDEPVFSEFLITNPASGRSYRVAIRGASPGENFCSCPDFATNELGTCKHVEFVLGRLERKRGGKAALARGSCPPYSEIHLQYGSERHVRFRRGSECPAALAKRAAAIFDASSYGTLPVPHFAKLDGFLADAQKTGHDVRCYEDALAFVAQVRDAQTRRQILDEAYPQGARSAGMKNLVKTALYPFQAEGALFAVRAGRCLIGDEMGLGKTIQAIAAVELFARHFGAERVLVVCPTSLKHQWQREIGRFTDRDARVINGLRAARENHYRSAGFCKITNYETVAKDLDLINAWSPDVVIIDEAQRIKNWSTIAAGALKRVGSPHAIVRVSFHGRRWRRSQSAARGLDHHQHGPAVEPGGARTAHRPGSPDGPEAWGAGGELRRRGDDRGRHALVACVQEVTVRRGARWRRE